MSRRFFLTVIILPMSFSPPFSAAGEETTTLSLSCMCSDNDVLWLSEIIPPFEARNPNITVEFIDYDVMDEEYLGEVIPEAAMAAYVEAVTAIVGEENTLVIPAGG